MSNLSKWAKCVSANFANAEIGLMRCFEEHQTAQMVDFSGMMGE